MRDGGGGWGVGGIRESQGGYSGRKGRCRAGGRANVFDESVEGDFPSTIAAFYGWEEL